MATERKDHPYHLVPPSPWPVVGSLATLVLATGGVLVMHGIDYFTFSAGIALLLFTMVGWWRDVIHEGNTPGVHTEAVSQGLRLGMALFIASEIMFFVAFFWAYFYSALFPTESTGGVWPPKGIIPFDPFHLPYFNTLILLLSGTTVTWAHHALLENNRKEVLQGLALSILLGLTFTVVQAIEYLSAKFALKDGIYPSTFYLATGFHGAHVCIGTIFLMVCWWRAYNNEFVPEKHVGFESAAWYWHFVDVVWLFLFIAIYWGSYRP